MTTMVLEQLKYDSAEEGSTRQYTYLSEWSPSLSSLGGLPGAGLVTQRSVQAVHLCVFVGVLVCNHGRVCAYVYARACALRKLCACDVC